MKFHSTLTNLTMSLAISKRYSGLTVDYGEYFNLTVDFYFDHGLRSKYRVCWSATPLHHATVCMQVISIINIQTVYKFVASYTSPKLFRIF